MLCGAIASKAAHATAESSETALRVQAVDLQKQGRWLDAAHLWQQINVQHPEANDAFKFRVLALSKGGAPYLAEQLAATKPDLFTHEEQYALAHVAAATSLNFGSAQIAGVSGPQRYTTTDQAIEQETRIATEFGARNPTRFDRLLGLYERERMSDVVTLFETLTTEQVTMPAYVRIAAGEAYLSLHQPERARDLLVAALAEEDPRSEFLNAQLALTFAYLEAGQPQLAIDLIDKLLVNTPERLYRRLPGIEQPNPAFTRIAVQAALLRIYTDRMDEAEQRLLALQKQAPFNNDVRLAWATLQNARDHRRVAFEEFRLLQVDHPALTDAITGAANSLLAQNEAAQAQALIGPLQLSEPDNRNIQQFSKRLALYQKPVFKSDIVIGRGAAAAGAESVFDTSLRSAPLSTLSAGDLRLFAHLVRAQGTLKISGTKAGREVERNRFGVGAGYRSDSISLDAELNQAIGKAAASGIAVAATALLSDSWLINLSADTNLNTLAAAAYNAGITARQFQLGTTWSANEARKAGLEIAATQFSDGNRRPALRLWWNERWLSGPVWKIDTTTQLTVAHNRPLATPYFNPRSEQELSIAAKVEWLTWQRYEQHFRQRLTLQAGQYRQHGFGAGALGDLHYEHEWALGEALSLTYGLGHSFHPYDGVREQRRYGYLSLNWILK